MTIDDFLSRLLLLYGPPESMDDEAFLDEYRDMLKSVDERILKPASDYIVATHTRRGWPTPAEVTAAVRKGSTMVFGSYLPPEHRKFVNDRVEPSTPEEIAEREASKARVAALTKAYVEAARGPPKTSRPVDLPWMDSDEFDDLMAQVPDRHVPAPKTGSSGGFKKISDVSVDLTKRITGERD